MRLHVYRKGYEVRPTDVRLKWYHYIIFFFMLESICYYRKHFVDFVDEAGKITRKYIK